MSDTSTIEQISGNYWYGTYGEFRVVMMKNNGYINATKMCQSVGKDYNDWVNLRATQELINELEVRILKRYWETNVIESDNAPRILVLNKNCTQITGTYCYADLISNLVLWLGKTM